MSSSYDDYSTNHIAAVNEAGDWLLQHCSDLLLGMNEIELRNQLLQHDESKYCSEEYDAYDHYFYFYSNNRSSKIVKNFNRAWLHHIHHNPHHWQHWVLIHDDEPMEPLEMPIECVVEMIADWWSFSYRAGNLYEILDCTGCCGNSDNITGVVDNRRGLRMFTEQIIRDPRGYYTLFIDGKFAGNYDTESEARQELYSMMNEAK